MYPLYHNKVGGWSAGEFSSPNTDLCVEGYQSSANTFVFNALHCVRPDLNYARHKHAVANVRLAVEYGVPTVILFRDPKECIPSFVSRFRPGVAEALYRYLGFYRSVVSEVMPAALLVSFEEAVGGIQGTVRRIAAFADFSVEEGNLEELEAKAKQRIQKRTQRRVGTAEHISLPDRNRETTKAEHRKKTSSVFKVRGSEEAVPPASVYS